MKFPTPEEVKVIAVREKERTINELAWGIVTAARDALEAGNYSFPYRHPSLKYEEAVERAKGELHIHGWLLSCNRIYYPIINYTVWYLKPLLDSEGPE